MMLAFSFKVNKQHRKAAGIANVVETANDYKKTGATQLLNLT
jgi:hypothetical protein